jgi:hypothetical protein
MKRRIFLCKVLIAGGALAGYLTTKRLHAKNAPADSPGAFLKAMASVRLQYVQHDLLLKLYSRQVSVHDLQQIVLEVVNHNANLFVVNAYNRHHGHPGFYRMNQ